MAGAFINNFTVLWLKIGKFFVTQFFSLQEGGKRMLDNKCKSLCHKGFWILEANIPPIPSDDPGNFLGLLHRFYSDYSSKRAAERAARWVYRLVKGIPDFERIKIKVRWVAE